MACVESEWRDCTPGAARRAFAEPGLSERFSAAQCTLVQARLYFDDLFPGALGKPLF
jgi:hypothetical protein